MIPSVYDILADRATITPRSPALTAGTITVSYAALREEADRFAGWLRSAGVERGDRVAVYLEKTPAMVASIFGAAAADAVFVPINPVLKPRQVAHILADSGATTLVTSVDRWRSLVGSGLPMGDLARVVFADEGGDASGLQTVTWSQLPAAVPQRPSAAETDLAAILYTSGSTGSPKGVALSHRNLVAGAESVNAYLGNTSEDVLLAVLPLSFDAGLSQLTTGFLAGAHVVLLNYLLPRDVVRACERHRVTGITGVPPLWGQLATLDWRDAGTSVRYFANTGGRMPLPTLTRMREHLPHASPFLMYGLTEAFRSTYLDPSQVDVRPDSIGRAIPNAEVLVLRPDGTECGPDEPGELVHRGPLVALGYWRDPVRTAERFRPDPFVSPDDTGWRTPSRAVWSGDTAIRDAEGFLYFVGRSDEMIKKSGYRISPAEIEEAFLRAGASEAVALGRPEELVGHRIVVVLGGVADTDEVVASVRRELPAYMLPDETIVLDSLPRNANGKFDRTALKETYG